MKNCKVNRLSWSHYSSDLLQPCPLPKSTDEFILPFLLQEHRQSLSVSSHLVVSIRPISRPSISPHASSHSPTGRPAGVRFRSPSSRCAPRSRGPARLQAETRDIIPPMAVKLSSSHKLTVDTAGMVGSLLSVTPQQTWAC